MADEATAAPPVEAPAPVAATDATETTQTNGDATIPKEDVETAGKQATTEVTAPDGEGTTEVAEAPSAALAEPTPNSSNKKNNNRKSIGGVPEHKGKKLNRKKSMPTLHLECKPGEHYWARLKGYPQWPSIICDEQMLPESLLASRPVSTTRPDGSLRDDFKEGGKNAKERTFPIMFLATNEFTWMVNTALSPLNPEDCTPHNSKMTKALKEAYGLASQDHDLDYFKGVLKVWQEEQARIEQEQRELDEIEAKEADERAQKAAEEAAVKESEEAQAKKKSKSRKSKGGDGDVEMADADAPKSSSKKRKNESDADGGKPKKTPKVTKLNAPKTPNGEGSTAKKSSTKSKKKLVTAPKEDEEDEKPQMTEAERMQQREKAVLYLRHRLQKGFLSRDQAPQESEMTAMADFFGQLEAYESLEPSIIRATKVHKVLKAIVKLTSIPKDEEHNFKKRSAAMLEVWNKRMEADGDFAPPSATEPKSAGPLEDKKKEEKAPEANGEKVAEVAAPVEAKEDSETKEGAEQETEKVTEEKAEAAAEKLDEKVEAAGEEKEEEDVAETPAAPAEKIEPSTDAMDVTADGEATKPAVSEDVSSTA